MLYSVFYFHEYHRTVANIELYYVEFFVKRAGDTDTHILFLLNI